MIIKYNLINQKPSPNQPNPSHEKRPPKPPPSTPRSSPNRLIPQRNVQIRKPIPTIPIHHLSRRQIRPRQRLPIPARPVAKHTHRRLETGRTTRPLTIPMILQLPPKRQKIQIIIRRPRRIRHSIHKTIPIRVRILQTRSAVHRLISHQIHIRIDDQRIAQVVIIAAVLRFEQVGGEVVRECFRALLRLRRVQTAGGVEEVGGCDGGVEGVGEEGVGVAEEHGEGVAGCDGGGGGGRGGRGGEGVVEEFGAGFGGEVCSDACVEGGGEGVLVGEDVVVVVIVDVVIVVVVLFLFFKSWEVLLMMLLIQWRDYLRAIDDLPARYGRSGMIVKIWRGCRDRSHGEKEGHEKPEPGIGLGHRGVCTLYVRGRKSNETVLRII